jgi:RHS repeat-associated protein
MLGGESVAGFNEVFSYDPIGNRTSSATYDEAGEARTSTYTANNLNQYTSRTVPGYAAVRGHADADATVTVNEKPTYRYGEYFFGSDEFDNSTASVNAALETVAVKPGATEDEPDEIASVTNSVYLAKSPVEYEYDEDGNMTEDARFRYYWNGENRMIRAEEKIASSGRQPYVVTYAYDHMGRNVIKDGAKFIWDEYNIIVENAASSNAAFNTWGLDLDGTMQGAGGVGGLLSVKNGDTVYLPVYDANGNVSEYVATNGTVAAHYEYSAFGEPVVTSGELAASFTHQFSTKPYCGVTGFSEYQMRKYRTEIGRWISRDPRKDNGFASSNSALMTMFEDIDTSSLLVAFINNNAIQYIDFLGLLQVGQPIDCGNCLICIDNDRGSGDGNGYKIHWRCGRPRPKTCRGGGSAQWPSGAPSHGSGGIPNNIRKCLDNTRWKLTPITVEVPTEENETCCKKSTFEYLTPVAKVGGACVAIYATYKVVKVCGGGTIGFFVGGPLGAISGVLFCLGTP